MMEEMELFIAQGGRFGGWALYVKNGNLPTTTISLDFIDLLLLHTKKLPAGKSTIKFRFAYDGGGLAKVEEEPLYQ